MIQRKKQAVFLATLLWTFSLPYAQAATCPTSCGAAAPSLIEKSGLEFNFYAGGAQNTTSNTSGVTFSPTETDTLTGANKTSSSFVPGVGVAYNYVMPGGEFYYVHAVSLGVNYYHTGMSRDGQVYLFGYPQFNNYTYKMGINSNRVMLDGEVDLHPLWHGLTVFGEAGVGGALNAMSYNEKSVLGDGGQLNLGTHTKLNFASEFGGGIKMPINKKSEISLRYLYANLGEATSNTESNNLTGELENPISTDVVSQSILLGYTYHVS